jgi:flagellar basal-body rod protein FlgC
MFSPLDISTSGLVANRARMNAISQNLANMSTTRNEQGELSPYQKRHVVFQAEEGLGAHGAAGVRVAEIVLDDKPPRTVWDPGHPDAKDGYVAYPNINMMAEFTDALVAARAYEANLGAMEITKDLTQQTLRILA